MKKRGFLIALSVSMLLAGCASIAKPQGEVVLGELSSIQLGEKKTTYHYNEPFEKPTVTAVYSSGGTKDVTADATVSGFNSRRVGTQTVTIWYEGQSASYDVTVVDEVKEITVSGQVTEFEKGESFVFGGIVKAVYDSGAYDDVTSEASFTGYDLNTVGTQTVKVTYSTFETSYFIEVKNSSSKTVSSIAVSNAKTEYKQGDDFVKPTVTATYSNGETGDVTNAALFSGYDLAVAGTQTVQVTYKNVSTSYEIVVKEYIGDVDDVDPGEDDISGAFKIKTDDGTVTQDGKVYTISSSGTYKVSGKLDDGQIYVNAPDGEVEINLNGTSIANTTDSPIYIKTADSVDFKIKKDSSNYIYDNRSTYVENETGAGAIYSEDGDLKIKGTGKLVVTSLANNGIHGKDDVTIKNATVVVRAVNHGIKGNDSITIEETPIIDIICGNDGLKTTNSDVSSKGNQRGTISITGGTLQINSYADGIDAAYDAVITDGTKENDDGSVETTSPVIDIKTNIYSSYSSTSLSESTVRSTTRPGGWHPGGPGGGGQNQGNTAKAADSAKGIKACNEVNISGGTISTYTYDDGIHGNKYTTEDNGTKTQIVLENGNNALGNVVISGGTLEAKASDDGVHADGTLTISGGEVLVSESYEGIEGATVNVAGGKTTLYASDDGANATSKFTVSGGFLDVTVPNNGDVDGIDSNGTYTQTGGTVIVRGPANGGAWSLDTDSTVSLKGGTIVVVGGIERTPSTSGVTKSTSSTGKGIGTFVVTIGSTTIEYTNKYSYSGSVIIYSSLGSATVSKK